MVAIAVAAVLEQLGVDHRGERHRRSVVRLRHDAVADRFERPPFLRRKKPRLARQGEPLVDHLARLLVPRRRVPLGEHVVAGIALAHPPLLDQLERGEPGDRQRGEGRRRRQRRAVQQVLRPVAPAAHVALDAVSVERGAGKPTRQSAARPARQRAGFDGPGPRSTPPGRLSASSAAATGGGDRDHHRRVVVGAAKMHQRRLAAASEKTGGTSPSQPRRRRVPPSPRRSAVSRGLRPTARRARVPPARRAVRRRTG